jgi:hypothetical protein
LPENFFGSHSNISDDPMGSENRTQRILVDDEPTAESSYLSSPSSTPGGTPPGVQFGMSSAFIEPRVNNNTSSSVSESSFPNYMSWRVSELRTELQRLGASSSEIESMIEKREMVDKIYELLSHQHRL